MLAHSLDVVIGVDSHRDTHALALVAAATGVLLAETQIEASASGYARALLLARTQAPGRRCWAIEGTGCYGAGLARYLSGRGELVVEVARPLRAERRSGKSDALDAVRAARSALSQRHPGQPRSGGERAALQALLVTRASAVAGRAAALCQLRALVVSAPEPQRRELRTLTRAALLARCASLRPRACATVEAGALNHCLRALARRARTLDQEARLLERDVETLVQRLAPALLAQPGVGPVSAAQVLACWSHHGRLHNEAAFARIAGAAPIPASSGRLVRHRLDRGGDRQLNRALHTIIVSRRKHHAETIAYIARRQNEGKTLREAIRCLKRYLARSLFRLLEGMPLAT